MKIIGLTGGIGSGKSTVTAYLMERGYTVIDADKIYKEMTNPGSFLLDKLAEAFGKEILLKDGSLDRKKLGEIVFSDKNKKMKLEQITHGKICDQIERQIQEFQGRVLFLDAPLLFETGLDRLTTEVWVVDTEDKIRTQRIEERDGLSKDEIEKRMAGQLSRGEKLKRATRIISNSGTLAELYHQMEQIIGGGI